MEMSENYLKLLYITKHNVNMSDSSDTWHWKNRKSLQTSTQIYFSIYI